MDLINFNDFQLDSHIPGKNFIDNSVIDSSSKVQVYFRDIEQHYWAVLIS